MWQDKAANQIIIGDWESETHALFVESEKIDPSSHKQPRQYGLNRGKNKQVRLFLSSADTFNAFRISESSQVAGSISQASKEPKNNADNRRESIGRDFEDKIQLT